MTDEKRPSLREAARRGVEAKQQAAPTTPAPAAEKAPRPAPPQKVKPPVVGTEQATARCGHAVPFELFEDKKDKYRDARRKKLTDRDCSACRVKAQAEKEAADKEAARKRRAEKPNPPPAPEKGRLPHGSRYDVAYDAGKEQWCGTLTVPGLAPITAEASAVFKLLRRLDDLYRAAASGGGTGAEATAP
jgi:hypothetical protein